MNDYLIDREVLEKFVDELIGKKTLPVDNIEELNNLREKSVKELDDKIGMAIFGEFTQAQNEEFNQLLDQNNENPDTYREFFAKHNINIEKITLDTMEAFAQEFLGGQNE